MNNQIGTQELKHSIGYFSKQIAEDVQVNMNLKKVKRPKTYIKENESITRETGSGRPQKLTEVVY